MAVMRERRRGGERTTTLRIAYTTLGGGMSFLCEAAYWFEPLGRIPAVRSVPHPSSSYRIPASGSCITPIMPTAARQYTNHESYAFQPNDDETDGGQICQRSKLHRSRLCHLHGAAQHGKVRESSSPHLRPRRAHSQSLPREVARHKAAVSHLSCFCSSTGGLTM